MPKMSNDELATVLAGLVRDCESYKESDLMPQFVPRKVV